MTAYARKGTQRATGGTAVWEIRSVNQRYLETYIRLPEQRAAWSRSCASVSVPSCSAARWSATCVSEAAQAAASQLHINEELARLIIDSANWVMKEAGQGPTQPGGRAALARVMAAAEQDMDVVATELMAGLT